MKPNETKPIKETQQTQMPRNATKHSENGLKHTKKEQLEYIQRKGRIWWCNSLQARLANLLE